jgi:protein-tyrosine kinase
MSKVHEALKRAEQEGANGLSGEKLPDGNGASGNGSVPAVPAVPAVTKPRPPAANSRRPLVLASRGGESELRQCFEQLLKQCARPVWALDPKADLFSESNHAVGAEPFRTLRSRLYQQRENMPLKRVLITSAVNGEGKTFVATNLAQAIACERDRPVLLIDGDLRSPKLHLPLGAPSSPGLSDYLSDQADEKAIVQHGQKSNLCFIAAGSARESASELLSNGRFEKLLDQLSPCFDWIIIDSPPSLPVADATTMARFCHGVLLVVRARSTPLAAVEKAHQELRARNVLGVVLNAVEKADALPYGHYSVQDSGNVRH